MTLVPTAPTSAAPSPAAKELPSQHQDKLTVKHDSHERQP